MFSIPYFVLGIILLIARTLSEQRVFNAVGGATFRNEVGLSKSETDYLDRAGIAYQVEGPVLYA